MPFYYKFISMTIDIPILGNVEESAITIAVVLFFLIVILLSIIILRIRKRNLTNIQLAAKPYSTLLETDEEYLSQSYERLYSGDVESAILLINKAIKLRPEKEDLYIIRGNLKFKRGDVEGALLDFSRTISLDPENASAHYQRGLTKQSLGLLDDAQIDFNAANELGYTTPTDQQ